MGIIGNHLKQFLGTPHPHHTNITISHLGSRHVLNVNLSPHPSFHLKSRNIIFIHFGPSQESPHHTSNPQEIQGNTPSHYQVQQRHLHRHASRFNKYPSNSIFIDHIIAQT